MTFGIELTDEEAVALLQRAVEEKGADYVYEHPTYTDPETNEEVEDSTCFYFDPGAGTPSCIVGHVLAYKGVTMEEIDGDNADTTVDNLFANGTVYGSVIVHGTDTDGTEWDRCIVHNQLVTEGAYVCEGYTPPPYDGGH